MFIRKPTPDETAFIVNSWILSWRNRWRDHASRRLANHKVLLPIIRSAIRGAEIRVAVDDQTRILAWMVAHPPEFRIDYAYTRLGERRKGHQKALARDLFAAGPPITVAALPPPDIRATLADAHNIRCTSDYHILCYLNERTP